MLGRLFAAARVQGFQGDDLKSTERLLACIKHFAAYGGAEAGLDYNSVDMSEARLREIYLQPYKAVSMPAPCPPWPRSTRSTASPRPATAG